MIPFILSPHFCKFYITCTIIFYSRFLLLFDFDFRWLRFSNADDSTSSLLANSTPALYLLRFYKKLQKSQKYFYLLCNSKEENSTVRYCTRHLKMPPRAKGARRPAEPSDLLYFEKAARLRQHT